MCFIKQSYSRQLEHIIKDLATSVKESTHWVLSPFMVFLGRVDAFSGDFCSFLFMAVFSSSTMSVAFQNMVVLNESINFYYVR